MAIRGCTNSVAYNYKPWFTEDDGSCQIGGCRDTDSDNDVDDEDRARPQFDANATYHDGSCPTLYFGCTDPLAYNYREICDASLCEELRRLVVGSLRAAPKDAAAAAALAEAATQPPRP